MRRIVPSGQSHHFTPGEASHFLGTWSTVHEEKGACIAYVVSEDVGRELMVAPQLVATLKLAAQALDNLLPDEYRRPATARPTRTVTSAEAEAITAINTARAALAAARGEECAK